MSAGTDLRFFTAEPFGQDYLDALRSDLQQAYWVRFLVCYFNEDGHKALAPHLANALQSPLSRGLITLTCACGLGGLEALWRDADHPRDRLRCFIPMKKEGTADAKLLHSKMAVLVKPGAEPGAPDRVVLYTGSHNWTGPGLRVRGKGKGSLNVEASLRLEKDWEPRWLEETTAAPVPATGDPVVDALNQIERCFRLRSSTDIGAPSARREIESWLRTQCHQDVAAPGKSTFIVAAGVLAGQVDGNTAQRGKRVRRAPTPTVPRAGERLFVQHFRYGDKEPETFDSSSSWALLLWERVGDLKAAAQPWLLLCRPRTLGQRDAGSPNLQSVQWLIYDPRHNTPAGSNARGLATKPPEHVTVSGSALRTSLDLEVEHWRVAPVKPGTPTQALNARPPLRYLLLEVVSVRRPRFSEVHTDDAIWEGVELPFHLGSNRVSRKGYVVHNEQGLPSNNRAEKIRCEQRDLFGLDHDISGGPTGEEALLERDFFPCLAPINELLFNRLEQWHLEAVVPGRQRGAVFEIPSDTNQTRRKAARVPRMEWLMAPGRPHIASALRLAAPELDLLGV